MRHLLLLVILCASIHTHAAHFNKFGVKDGLTSPAVLAIAQDSLGRIWLGTAEGISIYDGTKIISHKSTGADGEPLFKGSHVSRIVCSAKGDVFFRTSEALVKYDIRKETFQTVLDRGSMPLYSHQDTIWTVYGHYLHRWSEDEQLFVPHCKLSVKIAHDIAIDAKGRKWFSISSGIIYTDDDEHFTRIVDGTEMRRIFVSRSGDLWAGSRDDGLYRIRQDGTILNYNVANSSAKGLHNNFIRDITEDREGNIWFGTFNGLYKYDVQKDIFHSFTRDDKVGSISHSSVHGLFIDKAGILWVGTYFGGVNYMPINKDLFTFYGASAHSNSFSNPVIGNMAEDEQGNIWICTEGGGLNKLNPVSGEINRFETTIFPYYLPYTNLKCLWYDQQSKLLYIGTFGSGLYVYDTRQKKFREEIGQEQQSKFKIVSAIVPDGDTLFLSTDKGVYAYSLKTKEAKEIQYTHMFSNILLDADHHLWVIAESTISKFDASTAELLMKYELHESGIYNTVIAVFQSSQKDIYITTLGNGVLKLNRKTDQFEPFPSNSSSLLSKYCYRIGETQTHNLVITGDKGAILLNERGEILRSFPVGQYLPLDAFTRDCGLLISREGVIYLGGTNGLIAMNKKGAESSPTNNRIYFTELYVHNNLVHPNDASGILKQGLPYTREVKLSHGLNRIEVFFASHTPINNQQHIYEYRLKGVDKIWYQTTQRSVSYTNLTPGSYTLEVRESADLLNATPETAQLEIVMLPPWYVSWWAWLIWISLFLIVAGIVCNILYARKKLRNSIRQEQEEKLRIKEIDEAKFKFFTSVSHEFRTPLTLIIGQLEVLLQGNSLAPMVASKLHKVTHQCRQLSSLITELIEFRKYEQGHTTLHVSVHPINRYITEFCDGFRELALQQQIEFSVQPCEEEVEVWFDGKQITKVMYNLLSNAFKYTPREGNICVRLSVDKPKGVLSISIADSGVGIDGKEISHIFERFYQADNKMPEQNQPFRAGIGLALVKSIIEEHQGTIEVESHIEEGSVFTIGLQLGKEHLVGSPHILFDEETEKEGVSALSPNILLPDTQTEEMEKCLTMEGERPVIVLVEDNAELLEILVSIFAPLYDIRTAANGQEGLEIIHEVNPDLVVSDVMMPIMTGTELCDKIKNNIELCHIPIVLLTALNMPEQHLEGLIHGADDYIYKPFSPQILLMRCSNIVRSRRLLYKQYAQKAESDLSLLATNNLDKKFLNSVTALIDENISEPEFSVDRLASEMCMGRTSFYNKFKSLTGMSPNDFINSYKLKRAAIMLKQDNPMPVTEISDALGFSSPNYFCRRFKEQFKVSPSQFKQKGH